MTKYYVVYDQNTKEVVTRYDSDVNQQQIENPPAGLALLEVPDQQTMLQTMWGKWTVNNGSLVKEPDPVPTLQQIQTQALAQVDGWLTQKLAPTDWVIIKINEYNILGKQNTLATQYTTQLNQRQTYRQTAQTVKQQITAATTQQAIQTALSALT
jgi:hypothetical protein